MIFAMLHRDLADWFLTGAMLLFALALLAAIAWAAIESRRLPARPTVRECVTVLVAAGVLSPTEGRDLVRAAGRDELLGEIEAHA